MTDWLRLLRRTILMLLTALSAVGVVAVPTIRASTTCEVALDRIWIGDDGYVWLHYLPAGSAAIAPDDPDSNRILAVATGAILGEKKVIVRYSADGVACFVEEGRLDLEGIYLSRDPAPQ